MNTAGKGRDELLQQASIFVVELDAGLAQQTFSLFVFVRVLRQVHWLV